MEFHFHKSVVTDVRRKPLKMVPNFWSYFHKGSYIGYLTNNLNSPLQSSHTLYLPIPPMEALL